LWLKVAMHSRAMRIGLIHSNEGCDFHWDCGLLRDIHVERSSLWFWNCHGDLGPKCVRPFDAIAQRHELRRMPAGDCAHGTCVDPVATGGGATVGGHASGKEVGVQAGVMVGLLRRVNPP